VKNKRKEKKAWNRDDIAKTDQISWMLIAQHGGGNA
jgi:hypothetical protein